MKNSEIVGLQQVELDEIKEKIEELFEKKEIVHINLNEKKQIMENVPAIITGVYPRFVCFETNYRGYNQTFTIQFSDFAINKASINELN